jgi:dienelactone hydrolase
MMTRAGWLVLVVATLWLESAPATEGPAESGQRAGAAEPTDAPPFYPDKMNLLTWIDEQGTSHPIGTAADWQRRRQHILANLQRVMGRLPTPDPAVPLDLQVLESERLEKVTRKKVTYLAGPGDRIPAYLLIPHDLRGPAPAVVCLHGTSGSRGRTAGVGPDYARYTLELAERGYVTIAPDYTLLGDNQTDPESLGYTSGTMKGIWSHMRAVDLLQSLPEVDRERIGACGLSLGGHNALFLAAFDPRIRVAVTSSGFDSFADYMDGDLTGWCQKRYMPAISELYGKDPQRLPFDFPEVIAAIAPRAVYVHAPQGDSNFKVDSARRCVLAARNVYRLLDAEQSLVAHYPPGPHGFPSEDRELAYRFIDRVLRPKPLKVFILAGQSNMEGQAVSDLAGQDYNEGRGTLQTLLLDPAHAARFQHLTTDATNAQWSVRHDVWCHYQREQKPLLAGPLTMGFSVYGDTHHFGPELQFGHVVGDQFDEQVLLIKTAWGGKSLYRDFRPPSSGGEVGPYYTRMIQQVRQALDNLDTDFPDYHGGGYELAGFVWYHGWNDGVEPRTAVPEYEQNLVNLIQDVRRDLHSPQLPVVIGELTGPWVDAPPEWEALRQAQAAAAARIEPPGTAAFVPTRQFVRRPEDSPNPGHGHHEFGNAETYFLVGDALAKGILKLVNPAPATNTEAP